MRKRHLPEARKIQVKEDELRRRDSLQDFQTLSTLGRGESLELRVFENFPECHPSVVFDFDDEGRRVGLQRSSNCFT